MKYVIIALVAIAIGLGAIEHQIQSGIQKRSKIDRKVDSLMLVQSVRIQVLSNANDSLQRTLESHRRVIKLHGKAIKELAGLTSQMDSVLSKEVVNSSLAYKIGKRIKQVGIGLLGL